jgi:hypothetical protein
MHGTVTGFGSPLFNPQQQTAWGLSPQVGQYGSPYSSLLSPIQQQILQVLQIVPQQLQALQQVAYVQQQQLQQIQQSVQQLAQILPQQLQQLQPYGLSQQTPGAFGFVPSSGPYQLNPQLGQQTFSVPTSHVM